MFMLSHENLLTGPSSLGAITSSSMENGTIMGVPSGIPFSVRPFLENMSHHGISSSVPNSLPSLLSVESIGGQSGLTDSALAQGQLKFDFQGAQSLHPHSLPEYHDGLANGAPCNPVGTMAANINPRPERIENRQLSGANSNGLTVEHNDGGKCCVSLVFFFILMNHSPYS